MGPMSSVSDMPVSGIVAPDPPNNSKVYTQISHKTSSRLLCPSCHTPTLRRMPRRGFLQKVMLPKLGYFPWECSLCRKVHCFRDRGVRQRSKSDAAGE